MVKESTKKFTKRSLPAEIRLAAKTSEDKKAEGLCVLDLRDLSSFTDFFIIMNGNSSRHNLALMEGIEEELKKTGLRPLSIEGRETAEWVLMDYGFFLVHVFSPSARDNYSLDKLWGDAPRVQY
jgi:ribosome-associated protein